jgi:arabinogalactan oligomer/maltooligosaccharide transport system substrate-binding protein
LIGLPDSIKGVLMFRNKSIVPEAPATWEELIASAVENTEGDVQGAFLEAGPFFSMPHLEACGGKLMEENGDPAFNNEAGVCWMEDIFLAAQEAGIEGTINTDDDVNLFVAGKTGIIIDGLWNLGKFIEEVGEENLVIDPWPDTPQGNMSGYVQTENLYLNANATGDDAAAGLAFMEFFLSPEAQAIMADPTKAAHLPSVQGVEVSDPFFLQAVTAFEKGIPFPVIPEMGAYWGPIETLIRSVVDEGADPAEALATAEESVAAAIAEIRGE